MRSTSKLTIALGVIALSCFYCSAAFASSAHAEAPLPDFVEFLKEKKIFFINFIVYLVVLVYFMKKLFASAWKTRRAAYKDAITSGQELLKDSERQLTEAKDLLSSLSQQVQSLRVFMNKEVELEGQRILKEASERANKIRNQASQTAAAEKRAAINNYQEQLVELAIERARKRVSGLLSDEVDSRLRSRVVASVSGLVN